VVSGLALLLDVIMCFDQVDVGRLKDIRDDVNDYIENSQEPDFVENEYIYDDIEGLEDMLLDVSIFIFNSNKNSTHIERIQGMSVHAIIVRKKFPHVRYVV
jgi:CCR4-NOT transcriptional regulation complex NOT5 subunit